MTASRICWSQLGGRVLLERFDEALTTDHAVTLTSATPTTRLGRPRRISRDRRSWAQSRCRHEPRPRGVGDR